jgi:predicted nucleic acid-binding protein
VKFSSLLVRRDRNKGEAGVLALASVVGGIAVIDDGVGRRAAADHLIPLRGTLGLLREAILADLLTVKMASALVDDLLGSYRLPFQQGGFETWMIENGQLP